MVAVKMVKESHNDEDVTGLLREAEIMKVKNISTLKKINIKMIRFSPGSFPKPLYFNQ